MRLSRDTTAVLGLLAAFGLVWLVMVLQGDDPARERDPRPSTWNATPPGLKAWYLLLEESGRPVTRWSLPPHEAPTSVTLVVAIGSRVDGPTAEEARRLREWVRRGGRLVLLTAAGGPLPTALGARMVRARGQSRLTPRYRTPLTRGVTSVVVGPGRAHSEEPYLLAHLSDDHGIALGEWRLERGSVVLLTDPTPLTNERIGRDTNAWLALALAGERPVYFDEYHQTRRGPRSLWAQLPQAGRWALLQLALAAGLALWTVSRRFGTPLQPPEPARLPGEFVVSMAALLRRARAGPDVAGILADRFRHDLARAVGLRPEAADEELASAAASRARRDTGELRDLLEELERCRRSESSAVTGEDLLRLSRRIHLWREELELDVGT